MLADRGSKRVPVNLVCQFERRGHLITETRLWIAYFTVVGELDARLLGAVFQGFRERPPLVLHEEGEYISSLAAAEAVEELAVGVDIKRRRLLGMKRAESDEIVPASTQRHILADHRDDVGGLFDLIFDDVVGHGGVSVLIISRSALSVLIRIVAGIADDASALAYADFNLAIVTPSAPSFHWPRRLDSTRLSRARNSVTARRSMPSPLPWTMRTSCQPAKMASSR